MSIELVPGNWFHVNEMRRVTDAIAYECGNFYPRLSTATHNQDVGRPYLDMRVDMRFGHFAVIAQSEEQIDEKTGKLARRLLTPEEMGALFPALNGDPLMNVTLEQMQVFSHHWALTHARATTQPAPRDYYLKEAERLVKDTMAALTSNEGSHRPPDAMTKDFMAAARQFFFKKKA